MMTLPQRGFTLLIAVVLTSVVLSVGLALLDIAYKQITLSSVARQSQHAFYAADSAMECALYWDQQHNAFAQAIALGSITCFGQSISVSSGPSAGSFVSTFDTPCANGVTASVRVYKSASGSVCNSGTATSCLYTSGYSSCNADHTRRVERGLKVFY